MALFKHERQRSIHSYFPKACIALHDNKAHLLRLMLNRTDRKIRRMIKEISSERYRQNVHSIVKVNLCQKLFYLQNMGRTCCVQKKFWMSETISVHNMFSPGLSLEFSCIELVIQWRIGRHIVDEFIQKKKTFWQRFTCTDTTQHTAKPYWGPPIERTWRT